MKEKALKEVVNFIVSFLFDKTGSDIFDSWKEKRNIKKVLLEEFFIQMRKLTYIIWGKNL